MKKIITFMISLLIMTTMMSTDIRADDTGTITEDGGSSAADVDSEESVTNNCLTDEDVFKVTVSWSIVPGTYARTDDYAWNADELRYDVLKNGEKGESKTTDGTAKITLTNYSNTDVDYAVYYESKKVDEKAITSEKPTTQGTDLPSGTVASAATVETMEGTGNTAKEMIYNGTIEFADDYTPDNGDNSKMGTYTIKVSKHLTLNNETLTIKKGRTSSVLKASTPVTWKSDNENIATVDCAGKVTAVANGTANITAVSTVTGLTSVCAVTVRSDIYGLTNSQDDFDLLLETTKITSYTDPSPVTGYSSTVYSYDGFNGYTYYSTWDQAMSFIEALNDNNVVPKDTSMGTSGIWRLFKSNADATAWLNASGCNTYPHQWSSLDYYDGRVWYFTPQIPYWTLGSKTDKFEFIVIWQPTVSE